MGMFDQISVWGKASDGKTFNGELFQIKEFNCFMDYYQLRGDGKLFYQESSREAADAGRSESAWFRFDWHGHLYLTGHGDTDDYLALFYHGKLLGIDRAEDIRVGKRDEPEPTAPAGAG